MDDAGSLPPEPLSDSPLISESVARKLYVHHPRRWQDFHYVYPVVSRRSGGLSIGINLNVDKACNFDCVYCCVDRSVAPARRDVDLCQVQEELARMLSLALSGELWADPKFESVPTGLKRINDFAFSGDGEPTAYPGFDEACRIAVDLRQAHRLDDVKIVVITNATMFHRTRVRQAFQLLDAHNGEIWAKLDAGSEAYYRRIDRSRFPFDRVLSNILDCGRERPIVIQSLFMAIKGQALPDEEYGAYLDRLEQLLSGGCQIKSVQLYTTARETAEAYVRPLDDKHLDRLKGRLVRRFPRLPVHAYYGVA